MREIRPSGSVRGAMSNHRPYRDGVRRSRSPLVPLRSSVLLGNSPRKDCATWFDRLFHSLHLAA
jgi:hypothetical protein